MRYETKGVCSQSIDFEITDGAVHNVHFTKGCNGNGKGICALVEGMKVENVISRLDGLRCDSRSTSCPDQLAQALKHTGYKGGTESTNHHSG